VNVLNIFLSCVLLHYRTSKRTDQFSNYTSFSYLQREKKNSLTYAVTKNVVELNLEISYMSCVLF